MAETMFERVKRLYQSGAISADGVLRMVPAFLTEEEAYLIIGENSQEEE